VAKICNNMLLGISMVGVAEAMNLGLQLGIDKHVLAGIINTSSGRCWSSDTYNPVPGVMENVPSSRGYQVRAWNQPDNTLLCYMLQTTYWYCPEDTV
jgi:3-hydroxyisobutyrate dehydrogenase